jgi:hypothetical protein
MGRGAILRRNNTLSRSSRESGWSLIELTITLFLLMAIAQFGMRTMVSGFQLQNWSIAQSMTDAYAGIETAYAQRKVFADIPTDGRWAQYPAFVTTLVPSIGKTPFRTVAATVTRTYRVTDPVTGAVSPDPVTGAVWYLLESYVVYTDGQRTYCKVSKVYRDQ